MFPEIVSFRTTYYLTCVVADARPKVKTGRGSVDLETFSRAADIVAVLTKKSLLLLEELLLLRFI